MAQNTSTTATQTWTEITDADISAITIQNLSNYPLEVAGTTGSAPADNDSNIIIPVGGLIINEYLTDLFPGVASVDRVFIKGSGKVFFSHA